MEDTREIDIRRQRLRHFNLMRLVELKQNFNEQ